MQIVISIPSNRRRAWWVEHLQQLMPDAQVHDAGPVHHRNKTDASKLAEPGYEKASIDYAVVWQPVDGWLAEHPALRAVVSIGAGIDHVLKDSHYPTGVPVLRTTGDDLTQRMREYIALQVLRLHRQMPELEQAAKDKRWQPVISRVASQCCVGVMGMGKLGGAVLETLQQLGFTVAGWSRSPRALPDVNTFHGNDQLSEFLAISEILVCLLPLTSETRGILDRTLFDQLPSGASVINAARGGHLVESDLLSALDSGQIGYATLDVFEQEPLPDDHPFWTHPRILVTPHVASLIDPESGGRLIAANLREFHKYGTCSDLADVSRGY